MRDDESTLGPADITVTLIHEKRKAQPPELPVSFVHEPGELCALHRSGAVPTHSGRIPLDETVRAKVAERHGCAVDRADPRVSEPELQVHAPTFGVLEGAEWVVNREVCDEL